MNAVSLIDFRTPAAGFDQPLELWQACHERIADRLVLGANWVHGHGSLFWVLGIGYWVH